MTVPQVKGVCLKAALSFLREKDLLEDVLEKLPDHYRKHFSGGILPALWYPLESWVDLLEAVNVPYSREAGDLHAEIGGRVVEEGVNSILRGFFRAGATQWFIKQSPLLWSVVFKGNELIVEKKDQHSGYAKVAGDFPQSRALCRTVAGGIREALMMTGADNVRIAHIECRCDGARECVFEASWSR